MYFARELSLADSDALFAFETANRAWFERSVASRGDAFYTESGIHDHVLQFLRERDAGLRVPLLIWHANAELVGRANLASLNFAQKSGEVGYRVARAHSGQGVAQFALGVLLERARELGLKSLVGIASVENKASAQVLRRRGFRAVRRLPQHVVLGRAEADCTPLDCLEYRLAL